MWRVPRNRVDRKVNGWFSKYREVLVKKIIICLSFGLALSSVLYSQETVPSSARNRGAQYFLGSEDELLIPVNVWGFVQRPGQYMVPANTELITLLSYAGGPTESAKIDNIRIVGREPQAG